MCLGKKEWNAHGLTTSVTHEGPQSRARGGGLAFPDRSRGSWSD